MADAAQPHPRRILHVDMDSFFVSVELLTRQDLRGKPVAVAHDGARSVIASASYEARRYGVRSAMPVAQAKRRCPALILLEPNFHKYKASSRQVMAIFHSFTPLVEPLSIDEAFLDVTGAGRLFGSAPEIAAQLRERIRQETGLPASVGIATTKFVAKLASQRAKPDGMLEITAANTIPFLHSLSVREMWGVGEATAKTLESRAIRTVAQLAAEPLPNLVRLLGQPSATRLHELANGIDRREVQVTRQEKGIGHEETFPQDIADRETLRRELLRLSGKAAARVRAGGMVARTVTLKLRWADFRTVTRSRTLPHATTSTTQLGEVATELFAEAWDGAPIRLLGVRLSGLQEGEQLLQPLWEETADWQEVDATVDAVRARFGEAGLTRASLLRPRRQAESTDEAT